VLTQSREELIERTFESVRGARTRDRASLQFDLDRAAPRRVRPRPRRASSTSRSRRRKIVPRRAAAPGNRDRFEYSPESFTGTELDFALEICEAVLDVWKPDAAKKVILNLPATVEMATPNVYADQIEWFGRHVSRRDASSFRCIRTTTAAPASPRPSWPCWPGPTASRARSSAMASAPATSTSSRWR
jgi:2-isopropylmalate synthase